MADEINIIEEEEGEVQGEGVEGEVVIESTSSHIVKGKRTKRQRVQSPSPTLRLTMSPTSSFEYQDSQEQEDVDMANCLILLAQGRARKLPPKESNNNEDHYGYKFNSRKFMEIASTGTEKTGYYVYECKTCNRAFPSFQALGGHRASHKKPKGVIEERRNLPSPSLSLHLSNSKNLNRRSGNGNSKIHECSVCGTEFTSGQALGGHMRRHRSSIVSTNTLLTLTPSTTLDFETDEIKDKTLLNLDLDLNLPAAPDDKAVVLSKQHQQQQPPSPPIIFSSQALVDCHY